MIVNQTGTKIKKIFEDYDGGLELVEKSLRELFESNVFLIPLIGRYLIDGGGKRIRPLFLLISAKLAGYKGQDHVPLAAVIESIHTASLLHDDIVDGAELRRGRSAAHMLWGNQVVVLVGDYLYSNALRKAVSFRNIDIVGALSQAVTSMTEGELLQLGKSGDVEIAEEEYFRIASSKTGVLMSSACRIGGILGGLDPGKTDALASFGLKAGMTFQVTDDVLDYMAAGDGFGKKLGKDLEEGKITLPLIYLLRESDATERTEIAKIIENGPSEEGLGRILGLFKKYNVLEKALGRAEGLLTEAKAMLDVFEDCPEKQELFTLADYALQREH
ncbi:MAG: polyprenyl synthetase family protein [Nitrospiraceae bacterium]|nr:polyprenyl synthetase family protein [Nitrospiraceae bacterium]